jgi:hypothetical protein
MLLLLHSRLLYIIVRRLIMDAFILLLNDLLVFGCLLAWTIIEFVAASRAQVEKKILFFLWEFGGQQRKPTDCIALHSLHYGMCEMEYYSTFVSVQGAKHLVAQCQCGQVNQPVRLSFY